MMVKLLQRNKEKILEDISVLRDKMKAMVQEASRKESAETQLKEQVEKITKDVNRFVSMWEERSNSLMPC